MNLRKLWSNKRDINEFIERKHKNIEGSSEDTSYASRMFFFYLGFLSRTFTNHRTAGEGRGHFFNSSLPLSPALQTLRH